MRCGPGDARTWIGFSGKFQEFADFPRLQYMFLGLKFPCDIEPAQGGPGTFSLNSTLQILVSGGGAGGLGGFVSRMKLIGKFALTVHTSWL
jgi:hypothetical protein